MASVSASLAEPPARSCVPPPAPAGSSTERGSCCLPVLCPGLLPRQPLPAPPPQPRVPPGPGLQLLRLFPPPWTTPVRTASLQRRPDSPPRPPGERPLFEVKLRVLTWPAGPRPPPPFRILWARGFRRLCPPLGLLPGHQEPWSLL
uniref:Uncharacterized protein n=1 Tax=Molossus molossus TaxID=27622 RepID=A0A7J8FSN6_MOLMO|nr:hypothetical protein HJG59_008447 [Molossus molossus]